MVNLKQKILIDVSRGGGDVKKAQEILTPKPKSTPAPAPTPTTSSTPFQKTVAKRIQQVEQQTGKETLPAVKQALGIEPQPQKQKYDLYAKPADVVKAPPPPPPLQISPIRKPAPMVTTEGPVIGPQQLPGSLSEVSRKLTILSNVKETKRIDTSYHRNQYLQNNPGLTTIPKGQLGQFDVVKKGVVKDETGRLVTGYTFSYSPESKRKIRIAGSIENYDKYLKMVRKRIELGGIYAMMGGKGVGPLGIVPTMGWDLALASNKPGPTGATEREEILIEYLHRVKGSPEGGASLGGAARFIIDNPYVQLTAAEALPIVGAAATKTGVRVGSRAAPHIFSKIPISGKAASKLVGATSKLGGPAGQKITQREIYKNFMKWAIEGAVPAAKTVPKVISSSQTIKKLFSEKAKTYIDDMGNIVLKSTKEPIGYIDDFNRVIMYKPKRTFGFVEREFISPKRAELYNKMIQNIPLTTEEKALLRGKIPGKSYGAKYNTATLQQKLSRGTPLTKSEQQFLQYEAMTKGLVPDETITKAVLKPGKSIKEADFLMRGEPGKWRQFQAIIEESSYKRRPFRGIEHPYRSIEMQLKASNIPRYLPDEALLTETEAAKQALLRGKIPGRQYTSLYNIQKYRDLPGELPRMATGTPADEYLISKELSGAFTVASEKSKQFIGMKNIWAGRRWNPFTRKYETLSKLDDSLMNIDISDLSNAKQIRDLLIKNRPWENYEPHVKTAVEKLNKLGLATEQSGFLPSDPTKSFISMQTQPNAAIRQLAAKHNIKVIKTPEGAITFSPYRLQTTGKTLSHIKQNFDDFVRELAKEVQKKNSNIWAKGKKQWNPATRQWDDVAAQSLVRQPRITSIEEKMISEQLSRGGQIFGKGQSYGSFMTRFMIPEQRIGLGYFLAFMGARPMVTRKQESDIIQAMEQEQQLIAKSIQKQQQEYNQRIKQLQEIARDQATEQDQAQERITEQIQEQAQEQIREQIAIQKTMTEGRMQYKFPTRPIPRRGRTGLPPPPPPFPLIPPWPGISGKVASSGKATPIRKKYYNEYEAVQELLRNVIF